MLQYYIIPAEVCSDDQTHDLQFDATAWFAEATVEQIQDLSDCDWGGDYDADAVAEYFENCETEMADLLEYCRSKTADVEAVGYEVHVDSEAAIAYLREHRADILPQLVFR